MVSVGSFPDRSVMFYMECRKVTQTVVGMLDTLRTMAVLFVVVALI